MSASEQELEELLAELKPVALRYFAVRNKTPDTLWEEFEFRRLEAQHKRLLVRLIQARPDTVRGTALKMIRVTWHGDRGAVEYLPV